MKDFSGRLSSLTPEQRALFESRLNKKTALRPKSQGARATSIPKRKRHNHCLLSFDQERIWIIDRMEPGNPAYNIYTSSRLLGPLNIDVMERAVNEIVSRHEILRTTFSTIDGEPVMVIAPEWKLKLSVRDLSPLPENERLAAATAIVNEATALPFDLEKGPLLRVGIIRLADADHVLHVTMHHLVTDRWSGAVLEQEMVAIYSALAENRPSPLEPLEIQFADFAEWQREYLQGDVLAAKVEFWRNQLKGAPLIVDLPTDRPRPPFQKFRGAREIINLPEPLLKGLKAFTQAEGATMFMTLLAAYNLLLYRYTGQEDILVGLAMANRNRPETENMLGYLLNMVIIRAKFSARSSFRELLEIVRQSSVGAFANLDLPLGNLIEELKPPADPSRNPIFQMAYIYLDFPSEDGMEALKIKPVPLEADNGSSRFDMTLALTEMPDHLETQIEFNTDIFNHETIRRMLQHLRVLLEGVVDDPHAALADLPILTTAEQTQLLEKWNDTASEFPRDLCVDQLAELAANEFADRIAVASGDSQVTYARLNACANKMAHYLIGFGVGTGSKVAICLRRSPELIAALLGILKTGAAYVPVDSAYPVERISHMLEDALCHVVITEDALADSLPMHWGMTLSIDSDWQALDSQPVEDPPRQSLPGSPAYIIYTSGSTGGARGVVVAHEAISRLVLNTNYVALTSESVIAQCSNASFDAATFEIWGALLNGSRLVIIDRDITLTPREFSDEIRRGSVTVMFLTTALFNEIARHKPDAFNSLESLMFGGEAVTADLVRAVVEAGGPKNLLHVYGPTESTTFSSFFPVQFLPERETVPIGLPISNTTIQVIDRNLNPVPPGIDGELLIGGDGLAQFYLNRASLTAERFIPDSWSACPGKRLYRSGDLVRRREDGNIVFLGRNDFQVKIRGFRIELEEVESAIKAYDGVVDAVAALGAGSEQERRLTAYVVPRPGAEVTITGLRRFVADRMPEYMAPSFLVLMENLPLNVNGKVDRSKLPDPGQARPELALEYAAPATSVELSLSEVWARVLGLERVGIKDNFFDLGGDSIRGIQIISRAEEAGLVFSIQELFVNPTIESLAPVLESRNGHRGTSSSAGPFSLISDEEKSLLREFHEDAYPLTMLQAGMIFHTELSPATAIYHDIFSFHLSCPFEPELMRECLNAVIERHPVLRTSFNLGGFGRPLQFVHKKVEAPLLVEDISAFDDERQRQIVKELIESEKNNGFAWDDPPMLRLWLHKRSLETFQFTLSLHHAIVDGWSLATMLAELFDLFLAKINGRRETSYVKPISSFSDFVALEIAAVSSEEFRRFWTAQLDDAPHTVIPRGSSSKFYAEPSGKIGVCPLAISGELTAALDELSRRLGLPLKSALLAAHSKVLSILNGRHDVVTGIISNGRPEERDADRVLGLFLNTLPLRMRFRPENSWEELARIAFAVEMGTLPYRRYPMAEMQRITARNPMLEVAFNFTHFHAVNGVLGAKGIEILEDLTVSETNFPFLIDFNLDPASGLLQAAIKYDLALFDFDQIDLISGYYLRALHSMVENPAASHASSSLLSPMEIERLTLVFNSTREHYGEFRPLHVLVSEQTERTPDAISLISGSDHFSYEMMDRFANRIANFLANSGAAPDVLIGIAMDRSPSMCIALLGVLKTGAAYMPIDPTLPRARLNTMVNSVQILLTHADHASRLSGGSPLQSRIVYFDEPGNRVLSDSNEAVSVPVDPDNLCYVIFTSGSTGVPKGTAVSHRVASNTVRWTNSALGSGRTTLQFASISFDVTLQEIFSTWTSGGTLVLISDEDRRDSAALASLVLQSGVERLFLPVVALQQLAEHLFLNEQVLSASQIITAGEQLKISPQVRSLFELPGRSELHNHYGPSETHVATALRLEGQPGIWPDLPSIGKPIANAQVYLLNDELLPAPCGVPAEIFIGGDVVGRGYLDRPELTSERFVCNPFGASGSRLYRTGDLARHGPDGKIEFLGRLDHQVKVRGFRVEPGEIEAALCSNAAVAQAAVAPFDDGPGTKRLVAFVVPVSDSNIDANGLARFLRLRLPEYMVPSEFAILENLPLTASGKVDRRELRPPSRLPHSSTADYTSPATATEIAVARIWSEVLGRAQIGIRDNFFDLGGHSLIANQIVSRIRAKFGSDIPLRKLFDYPTISELGAYIDQGSIDVSASVQEPIPAAVAAESSPLSIAQRRLWFLDQLDPHKGAYHIALSLRVDGELSLSALEQALAEIVRRHEVLRSRISEFDGSPLQTVEVIRPVLNSLDLTGLDESERTGIAHRLISLIHSRIFDLAKAPLIRTWIVKVAEDSHILAVTMHHLVSDGWSGGIFNKELAALYDSHQAGSTSTLKALPAQYRDFAVWQSDWPQTERFESELAYWKRKLDGVLPTLDLPSDYPRPAARTFNGATVLYSLEAQARTLLKQVADTEGATMFMAYLASFLSLLFRYTGQTDIVIGVPISGRNRPEIESLIGCFVNTLALRTSPSGSITLREMIRQVREVALEAYANQDLPFEHVVEALQLERNQARSPVFDVLFDLRTESVQPAAIRNVRLAPFLHDSPASKFDLSLSIADSETDPSVTVEFSTDLFERASIDRLMGHFNVLIEDAAGNPDLAITQLALMPPDEVIRILEDFNDTDLPYPAEMCVHELFDLEAERRPDAIALVFENESITYDRLEGRANALARILTQTGIKTDSRVGVCLPRSIDMVIALVAVLKAGGAYVPMDVSYPQSRLQFMAADARLDLLLTVSELLVGDSARREGCICLDTLDYGQTVSPSPGSAFPQSLAYVIYTSGTTGNPKGVAVSHRGVVRLVKNANYAEMNDRHVFLQLTMVSFDVATFEIWGALLNGGRLVLMPDHAVSLEEIGEAIAVHGITTMWLTAGLFHLMVDRLPLALSGVQQLLAGGEALQADDVNKFIAAAGPGRLINGYGPTEVTTFTCCYRFNAPVDPGRAVPIGRPVSNTEIYLLDSGLNLVPGGVRGQLYASGPGVARGYLNNPDLTAERFVPNPFSRADGDRMYATGDIGSYLNDGNVEFLGRLDSQIKLRGFRIELGEIESFLSAQPDISGAVVVVHTDGSGERRLAAYVTERAGATITPEQLRERTKSALPDFMVPSSFQILERLPLTRSGKVDRRALPDPRQVILPAPVEFEESRSPIEEGLVRIWAAVLGRDRIGINQDFFDLGGHSLLATQVVSRIREAFQVEFPLRLLFQNRTIGRLSEAVEAMLLDKLDEMSEEEAAKFLE